jgi:hypothetical protein
MSIIVIINLLLLGFTSPPRYLSMVMTMAMMIMMHYGHKDDHDGDEDSDDGHPSLCRINISHDVTSSRGRGTIVAERL